MFVYRASLSRWLLAVAFFGGVATARDSLFDICRDRISSIRNGTSTFNGITNETIEQYIHFGPVRGLPTELRDNLTVITTAGMLLRIPYCKTCWTPSSEVASIILQKYTQLTLHTYDRLQSPLWRPRRLVLGLRHQPNPRHSLQLDNPHPRTPRSTTLRLLAPAKRRSAMVPRASHAHNRSAVELDR